MTDYKKACACKGKSSGPRIWFKLGAWHKSENRLSSTLDGGFAQMVCDVCETPWKKVEPKTDTQTQPASKAGFEQGERNAN